MAARAVALGKMADPATFGELLGLLGTASAEVRRLAALAIGKLAGHTDPESAIRALQPLLRDPHPQVRQYAVKALSAFGAAAKSVLADLRDLEANPSEKEYNRRDARKAIEVIDEAWRVAEQQAEHRCQRCSVRVNAQEYSRSQRAFQRVFCDKCFDEVYLERRNFDTRVEINKTIRAESGTLVQSDGERVIAEYLARHKIAYRYDERIRIIEGYAVRPDFYLPEFDVYLEYWGMDTLDYRIGMLKKLKLYQQEGKRVISVYREDKTSLDAVLRAKLSRYMKVSGVGEAERSQADVALDSASLRGEATGPQEDHDQTHR